MTGEANSTPGLRRRAAVVAAALAGWVLMMVVAAGPRPDGGTWIGLPALDDLMGVAFIALVVWAVVWTARVVRVGSAARARKRGNLITLWLGLAMAILIAMFNPSIVEQILEFGPDETITAGSPELDEDGALGETDFQISATQVYLILTAVGAWFALTMFRRRREADQIVEPGDEDLEVVDGIDLRRTVERMVDDLEVGPDPRAAVLAAYYRLEGALADADRSRRTTETPTEHLDRVLASLPTDRSPFLDLARRYELARFSDHPITEADRDRAVVDLARASADLGRLNVR